MHKHNILRLDIPMQDLLLMNVTNRIEQVPNNKRRRLLRERIAVLYNVVQLPSLSKL